ncbi:MAG: Asp-tRNA(Asn)/Glu-tRNA(Gln) amidotransferase subunit GatC [Patescibacteria group bacterium]
MSKKNLITKGTVRQMIRLSNLKVDPKELNYFTKQFDETLIIVNKLSRLSTENISRTSNVTGLKNIFRRDVIERDRMFTQKEALSNAKKTHKGYFLVKAIFDEQ